MTHQTTKMFGLDTIDDYLNFCSYAVAELERSQDDVLRAFAAIIALNHLPDWLSHKLTAADRTALRLTGWSTGDCVKSYFETRNSDLKLVREIANGFKHLRLTKHTAVISGYGSGPYGVGPFGAPYLLIDLGEGHSDVVLSLCKRTLEWWRHQLSILAPKGTPE